MRHEYLKEAEGKVRDFNKSINEQITFTNRTINDLKKVRERLDQEILHLEKLVPVLKQTADENIGGLPPAKTHEEPRGLRDALHNVDRQMETDNGERLKTSNAA